MNIFLTRDALKPRSAKQLGSTTVSFAYTMVLRVFLTSFKRPNSSCSISKSTDVSSKKGL